MHVWKNPKVFPTLHHIEWKNVNKIFKTLFHMYVLKNIKPIKNFLRNLFVVCLSNFKGWYESNIQTMMRLLWELCIRLCTKLLMNNLLKKIEDDVIILKDTSKKGPGFPLSIDFYDFFSWFGLVNVRHVHFETHWQTSILRSIWIFHDNRFFCFNM